MMDRAWHLTRSPDGESAAGTPSDTPASDPTGGGFIIDMRIERELQDSYLTYAMSTIMDRALPDVRDGLKPSQRRLLYGMNELRVFAGKKHVKCAKIVGDVMGNYHPHGDAALYGTLVGMAQGWRQRVTFVDPQGNFGSIAPDPPASMRYTEARMAAAAMDMIEDLHLDTVDMQPNYDDSRVEPSVLPAKFPNLLVNGGVGIAVGMATSMAPNNPTEVLDSIIRYIENPQISLGELMKDVFTPGEDGKPVLKRRGIRGPDFPTGGILLGRRGLLEAYETGRGKVTLRGRVRIEPLEGTKDRQQLVIEQIPFNLGLDTLIERIKDAVEAEKITDISDARNESSAKSPVRVVIELKKGADPIVVEKQLYEYTALQQTFSIQNIALVNRQPRTLSILEMIRYYVDHRVEVVRRRTAFLLQKARHEAHILEGMIFAVCDIDEVIRLIRSSRTRVEAIAKLMARRFQIPATHPFAAQIPPRLLDAARRAKDGGVALSKLQADTIGNMRLIQLTGLEIEKLVGEYAGLVTKIEGFEAILADHAKVLAILTADCESMRERYRTPRATELQDVEGEDLNIEALIREEDVAVTISHQGHAKRVPLATYRQQNRGGKGIIGSTARDDDFIEHVFVASTHDNLLCFTNTGRVFCIKVYMLEEGSRQSKGRALRQLLEMREGEKPVAFLNVRDFEEGSQFLTFISVGGIVKRTPLKEYRNVNKGGLIAVDIKHEDQLLDVILTGGRDDLLLATAQGNAIRFPEDDVRVMGRAAAGVKGIELADNDHVVGAVAIPMTSDADGDPVTADPSLALLTVTINGYGKRTLVDEYRVQPEIGKARSQSRGGKGRADIKITERNGISIAAIGVLESEDIVVGTKEGQVVRMAVSSISTYGRATQGVRVVSLNGGDQVTAVSSVPQDPSGPSGPPGDSAEPTPAEPPPAVT